MRAIDYGKQYFGGISYKNTKSNIIVFNEGINLGTTEDLNSNELFDYHCIEIEFTNEEQSKFIYVTDGEKLSGEQIDYIKNSGIIPWREVAFNYQLENISDETLNFNYSKVYEIEGKFFIRLPGKLDTVEVTTESKLKKNKPLILLNDILNEKSTSVVVFISDDGVKLERAYQNIECYNNEVVLFIENDFGSNLFGSVLRIKLGDSITENSNFPASQTAKVINAFKLGIDIDSSTLANAIVKEIKSNDGLLHYIRKRWWAPDKLVTIPLNFTFNAISDMMDILLNGVENGKLKEERWRYYNSDGTKNKEANLLFFNPDTFDDLEEKAKKNAHKIVFSKALKEVNKIENSLQISLKSINQNKVKFDGTTLTISKTIDDVFRILKPIKEFLSNPEAITISIGKNVLIAINAFLVGLINSILDIFGGILFIIKLLCSGFIALDDAKNKVSANFSSYVSMFLEGIENLADTVKNLFTKENLKAFLNFLVGLQDILFAFPLVAANFILNTDVSINIDTFGYYYGYIIGVIIDLVIGILLTGGAKTSADVVRLLSKQFEDIFILGEKFVKKSGKLAIKSLDEIIAIFAKIKQGVKNIKPLLDEILEWLRKIFDDALKTSNKIKFQKHLDNFKTIRPKFQDEKLVTKLWNEKINNKLLYTNNLRKLYLKYLDQFPALKSGFNQAEFKTIIKKKGKLIEEIEEFSISGNRNRWSEFGDPPKLPPNTINVLDDWENFEKFVDGAIDFSGGIRKYDSEIKYIFNFLKNHMNKGDEFVIETRNIFKTCGSCKREFVMLEDYLRTQGKKVKIIVYSDETIKGTEDLKIALKLKNRK